MIWGGTDNYSFGMKMKKLDSGWGAIILKGQTRNLEAKLKLEFGRSHAQKDSWATPLRSRLTTFAVHLAPALCIWRKVATPAQATHNQAIPGQLVTNEVY